MYGGRELFSVAFYLFWWPLGMAFIKIMKLLLRFVGEAFLVIFIGVHKFKPSFIRYYSKYTIEMHILDFFSLLIEENYVFMLKI